MTPARPDGGPTRRDVVEVQPGAYVRRLESDIDDAEVVDFADA